MVSETSRQTCQVLICGSGCAGSLLAWILARQGMDVTLIDRGRHPRFAIGESSTPLADFLLEQISERYDLPELKPLARWGSWRRAYPDLRCGKKRGFSYYGHSPQMDFSDDAEHSRSLLVAASASDEVSDTHWMRSDVDHWLCQQACAAGATYREGVHVGSIEQTSDGWQVTGTCDGATLAWTCDWLIDATGNAGAVPQAAGGVRCDDELHTQTGSIFGHFTGVQPMTGWLREHGFEDGDDPFDGDDAAQHHVLEDGWMWMLRFDCGIASVGITRPSRIWNAEGIAAADPARAWREQLQRYATLDQLLSGAQLIGPLARSDGQAQPALAWIPRISRLWSKAAGTRWLALPSTVGIIDPLHSTGIAHALSGVERAAEILLHSDAAEQDQLLARYDRDVVDEVRWIDQLVSVCYAGLPDFELFAAACNFYFLGAIECERDLRSAGELKHGFLGARRSEWRELVSTATQRIQQCAASRSVEQKARLIDWLRQAIEPWNQAGLLNPQQRNRYSRSAAPK
ncbi:MAG: NAD(P)/FAD-dependent oxidoreductase [Aureliella sp.]